MKMPNTLYYAIFHIAFSSFSILHHVICRFFIMFILICLVNYWEYYNCYYYYYYKRLILNTESLRQIKTSHPLAVEQMQVIASNSNFLRVEKTTL